MGFVGRVLNRFSKDLGFLDDLLPYQFYDYLNVSEGIICPMSFMSHIPTYAYYSTMFISVCTFLFVLGYCTTHHLSSLLSVYVQYLPVSLVLKIFLRFLSILVISGIANHYIFIPIVLVLVVFLVLRAYYLTSAREVKRLEAIGEYGVRAMCIHCWSVYCRLAVLN